MKKINKRKERKRKSVNKRKKKQKTDKKEGKKKVLHIAVAASLKRKSPSKMKEKYF